MRNGRHKILSHVRWTTVSPTKPTTLPGLPGRFVCYVQAQSWEVVSELSLSKKLQKLSLHKGTTAKPIKLHYPLHTGAAIAGVLQKHS